MWGFLIYFKQETLHNAHVCYWFCISLSTATEDWCSLYLCTNPTVLFFMYENVHIWQVKSGQERYHCFWLKLGLTPVLLKYANQRLWFSLKSTSLKLCQRICLATFFLKQSITFICVNLFSCLILTDESVQAHFIFIFLIILNMTFHVLSSLPTLSNI